MKAIVVGAGVIGTTSAYYLARAGCDVTVFDRSAGPALETSFANAGQLSYGYSAPWAAPGVPLKSIRWLFQKHSPLSIRPDWTVWQLQWIFRFLRNCSRRRYALTKSRMVTLAEYSRECLDELHSIANITYEARRGGTLQLFRTRQQSEDSAKDISVLEEYNVRHELLDANGCVGVEPALEAVRHKFVGGLRLLDDETGDCYIFTKKLADKSANLGVKFVFNASLGNFVVEGNRVRSIDVNGERTSADLYVIACGSFSRGLLLKIGVTVPVYPVKGYSITVPIVDSSASPVSTVMDETFKVAITRFDNRIRVGGMAEIAGFDRSLNIRKRQTLVKVLTDLFPRSSDINAATCWAGLRPMTADGFPRIGCSRYTNLWVNTGHGTLGWTLACGSARLLADRIMGRVPEIDFAGLLESVPD